jgi:hypothetical protein
MNQDSYNMLENMAKHFRLDDNAKTSEYNQRTASVANNIQSTEDQLCAKTISEIVKLANERVNNNNKSRTASVIVSSKIDEVGLLQSFLSRYQ